VAIEWMENWGHHRDFSDLAARYTLTQLGATSGSNLEILGAGGPTSTPAGSQAPRAPAPGCIRFGKFGGIGSQAAARVKFDIGGTATEIIIGWAFLWEGVQTQQTRNDDTILFINADPDLYVELNFGFSTNILASRGYIRLKQTTSIVLFDSEDDADNAGDVDFHALQYGRWYNMEIRFVLSNTVGEVEFRVDGETWYSETGLDTIRISSTVVDNFSIGTAMTEPLTQTGHGAIFRMTDLYVLTTSGGNETSFLFPWMVSTLYPNADTVEADWVPQAAGTNVAEVDDNPKHDFDSTHNESNTNTDKDRFTTSQVVPESTFGRVYACQVIAMAKDTLDTAAKTARVVIFENLTEAQGTTRTLTESEWQALWHVFEDNPDTSAAWLMADVEAAQIGYELVS